MIITLPKIVFDKKDLGNAIKDALADVGLKHTDVCPLLVLSSAKQPVYIKDVQGEYILGYDKLRYVVYIEYFNRFTHTSIKGDIKSDSLIVTNAIEHLNIVDKEKEPLKFAVNPDESEIIQFILGNYYDYRWSLDSSGPAEIRNIDKPYLYFSNGQIKYGDYVESFREVNYKEYDFASFIKDYYVFKNK